MSFPLPQSGLLCAAAAFALVVAAAPPERPKGDAARGKAVFESHCEECHDAYSKDEVVGPGLQGLKIGKMPDGRPAGHDELLDIINRGPDEMPAFKDLLSEQEKEDVVAFVMTL